MHFNRGTPVVRINGKHDDLIAAILCKRTGGIIRRRKKNKSSGRLVNSISDRAACIE